MYTLLTLFFISIIGITIMIGRKLLMLQNGKILQKEEFVFKAPDFEALKHLAIKKTKKHGYNILVTTIRLYFRSGNILKNKYQDIKTRIKDAYEKKSRRSQEEKEVSRFLKTISEYKHKIRELKHRIKEEENA